MHHLCHNKERGLVLCDLILKNNNILLTLKIMLTKEFIWQNIQ